MIALIRAPDDQPAADPLTASLAGRGVVITPTLTEAGRVVLLFSPRAAESPEVRASITAALVAHKPVIAVLAEPAAFGDFLFLLDADRFLLRDLEDPAALDRLAAALLDAKPAPDTITAGAPSGSPADADSQFFAAVELIDSSPGAAIYLLRDLLAREPGYADGQAVVFVADLEAQIRESWLGKLSARLDEALAGRDWAQAETMLTDAAALAGDDPAVVQPLRDRLIDARLAELLEQADERLSARDHTAARRIADEMLALRADDPGAEAVLDRISGWAMCDALYDRVRAAVAQERMVAISTLMRHINRRCPDYGDPDGLLRHTRIVPGLAPMLRVRSELSGHSDVVHALAFSPDGAFLASGGKEGSLRLWDVAAGRAVSVQRRREGPVRSVCYDPDGQHIASISGGQVIRVWAMPDGSETVTLDVAGEPVDAVIFTPDGLSLIAGDIRGVIRVIRLEDGQVSTQLQAHRLGIHTLALSPDGTLLASAGADKEIRVWRLNDVFSGGVARPVLVCQGHQWLINQVAFSADGAWIGSVANDSTFRLWNAADGSAIATGEHLSGRTVKGVAFSPHAPIAASAGYDNLVRLWELPGGQPLHAIEGDEGGVEAVAFSPDGTMLASAGVKGRIVLRGVG